MCMSSIYLQLLINMSIMATKNTLTAVCYNMHSFNQGLSAIHDLRNRNKPDVILIQEHWLTEANLYKFDQTFPEYFYFGSPAISSSRNSFSSGRPAGGTGILINSVHKKFCRTLFSSHRCVIAKLFDFVIINIYMPCVGFPDRLHIIEETLGDIYNCVQNYDSCIFLLGGDFNCVLDNISDAATAINQFAENLSLHRCDKLTGSCTNTYVNLALNSYRCIDYFFISNTQRVITFNVLDTGSNL